MVSNATMGMYITMIHNQFKEQLNRSVEQLDLTTSQIHVLFYLKNNENREVIQKDIEERFNLSNPTVTGIIKRLETKGFIERSVSSKDARSKKITMTEKSYKANEEMKKAMHEANEHLLQGISEEELGILEGCFKRMLHNLEG